MLLRAQVVNDPTGTVKAGSPGAAGPGLPLANGHRASPAGSPAPEPRPAPRAASPALTQGAPHGATPASPALPYPT